MKSYFSLPTLLAMLVVSATLAQGTPDTLQVQEHIQQAKKHYFVAQYDSLLQCSQKALDQAKKIGYLNGMAQAYNLSGAAYFTQGDLMTAQHYFDSTRITYQSANDSVGLALALCNLGHIQESYGDYEQALHFYWQEFSVSEAIGDANKMGAAYEDIGRVQQAQGNYAQALSYYEQALAFFQSQNDAYYIASTMGALGELHTQHQSWSEGVAYLKQALEMIDSLNNPDHKASLLNSLARAYQDQGQLFRAMQYYDQVMQIDSRRVSSSTWLHSLTGAAAIALDLQQNTSAKRWILTAEKWISQHPTEPHDRLHLEKAKASFYKETQQYAQALKHYETADLLEDSLLNADKIARLSELQTRYETEKKDREIAGLQYQQSAQQASLIQRSWQRNVSIGLLIALILISGLVFRTFRMKQRHQQALLAQEHELHLAKSRFFAEIAHEFRSPLTLIQGPAEQILTQSTDSDCRQYAKLIRKQSDRLLQLVKQILYLSRLEAGVISLNRTKQDLVTFLRGMVHAYESLAEQYELNLRFRSSTTQLITSFDKDLFEKIFTNLLTNASKFTPPQGTISLEISTPNAQQIAIEVRDTGRGIPEEHLPHIFDRYYTASDTHDGASGAGIGLALTKELVERHQGAISAFSKPGEETVFRILLPFHPTAQPEITRSGAAQFIEEEVYSVPEAAPVDAPNLQPVNDNRALLLIIDDNPEIRSYLTATLNPHYAIIQAPNGEEGLNLAFQQVPDLIISDVLMAGMNGYQVCKRLKTDDRSSHIPVILLTGKEGSEAKITGLEAQADDYLTKPFNSRELLTRINNLINVRKLLLPRSSMASAQQDSPYTTLPSREKQFLSRITMAIEEHLSEDAFGVAELCVAVGMSRTQLHRKLKALTGASTTTFIRQVRLSHSMQLLQTSDLSVSEIAYLVGFNTPAYFSTRFTEHYSYSPSEVRGRPVKST